MSVIRDKKGRPLITPPGGGEPVPYIRASGLSSVLDDRTNLHRWQQRKAAMGFAAAPNLVQEVVDLQAECADPAQQWPQKQILDRVVRDAMAAGRADEAASAGTRFHDLAERVDRGEAVEADVPTLERLQEYLHERHGVEVVDAEQFVVNDALGAAGTYDRLLRLPDGRVVIADIKTGRSDPRYPLGVCVQCATYSHAERYDVETGRRAALHPDLDPTVGLLIHAPLVNRKGVHLYWLNLTRGYAAAKVARDVHLIRDWSAEDLRRPV